MTKNVTLLGASYPDVPSIILPQTGGGSAEFYADKADWFGANAELVKTLPDLNWTLADTSYSTWTPTATATVIKDVGAWDTFSADMANYEYVFIADGYVSIEYADGTTSYPRVNVNDTTLYGVCLRRPNTYQRLVGKIYNIGTTYTTSNSVTDFYNTSNTRTVTYGNANGVYLGIGSVTYSNTTSDNPTITVRTPYVYARANATYQSTDSANAVTGATIMVKNGKVYRVDKWSSFMSAVYKRAIDFYGEMNPPSRNIRQGEDEPEEER